MEKVGSKQAPLAPYRFLELADEKGAYAGRILADLGAEVIKIEKPGGDSLRDIGPFLGDVPHQERSLQWFVMHANKKSITLNIETEDGRLLFKDLVKEADGVIESFPPGFLRDKGLDYDSLCRVNPALVMASISPYGQEGPYKSYKGSDIAVTAMGGLMYITGEPGRPPLRISVPQAYCHAGTHAVIAILYALFKRDKNGQGEYIDVSAQAAIYPCQQFAPIFWDNLRVLEKRSGQLRRRGNIIQRHTWPCKDGYVCWALLEGPGFSGGLKKIIEWMKEEGMAQGLSEFDTQGFSMQEIEQPEIDRIEKVIGDFFLAHTKNELYKEGGIKRKLPLSPVHDIPDMITDPQLQQRDSWKSISHQELNAEIVYPARLWKSSACSPEINRRAPLIGEHNKVIYKGELGLTSEDLVNLKSAGVI